MNQELSLLCHPSFDRLLESNLNVLEAFLHDRLGLFVLDHVVFQANGRHRAFSLLKFFELEEFLPDLIVLNLLLNDFLLQDVDAQVLVLLSSVGLLQFLLEARNVLGVSLKLLLQSLVLELLRVHLILGIHVLLMDTGHLLLEIAFNLT